MTQRVRATASIVNKLSAMMVSAADLTTVLPTLLRALISPVVPFKAKLSGLHLVYSPGDP
jgi:hypothetical protein